MSSWTFTKESKKKPKFGQIIWFQTHSDHHLRIGTFHHSPLGSNGPTSAIRAFKPDKSLSDYFWRDVKCWLVPVKPAKPPSEAEI